MKKNENKEIDQIFGDFSEKLSAVKSETEISPDLQAEYISYHDKIDLNQYEEDDVIRDSAKLFEENVPGDEKKRILFILAHIGTLPGVRIIEEYTNKASGEMKVWSVLSFEEAWMFLENEAMVTNQTKIFSGTGGDGERLRYYFIISSKDNFTDDQKDMIEKKFKETAGKLDSKIETIDFVKNYALIMALVSMDVAVGNLIETSIKSCNNGNKFLRFHYFATNIKKPDEEEIRKYLDELKK